MIRCSAVGAPETVMRRPERFAAETGVGALILAGQIYDHAARLRSFDIAAEVCGLTRGGREVRTG